MNPEQDQEKLDHGDHEKHEDHGDHKHEGGEKHGHGEEDHKHEEILVRIKNKVRLFFRLRERKINSREMMTVSTIKIKRAMKMKKTKPGLRRRSS